MVRPLEDIALVGQELRHTIGAAASALYPKADICRRDLLAEIEAVGN
jgi:hypothetical protein